MPLLFTKSQRKSLRDPVSLNGYPSTATRILTSLILSTTHLHSDVFAAFIVVIIQITEAVIAVL